MMGIFYGPEQERHIGDVSPSLVRNLVGNAFDGPSFLAVWASLSVVMANLHGEGAPGPVGTTSFAA